MPSEPNVDPLSLVPILSLKDSGEAEVLRMFLESEGVPCVIDGEGQAGLSGILDMKLLVRAQDADHARKLLHERD